MQQSTMRLTQPKREKAHIKQTNGLPVRKNTKIGKRFVYVHYAKSWEFAGLEWGFLPIPKKVVAVPGCNGVGARGDLTPVIVRVTFNTTTAKTVRSGIATFALKRLFFLMAKLSGTAKKARGTDSGVI